MKTVADSVLRIVAALLVVISTIGAIIASQQYFTLVLLDDVMQSERELQESFATMLKARLGTSETTSALRESVETESEELTALNRSIVEFISTIRVRQVVDISLWVLVSALSATVLVIEDRKRRAARREKGIAPSKLGEGG